MMPMMQNMPLKNGTMVMSDHEKRSHTIAISLAHRQGEQAHKAVANDANADCLNHCFAKAKSAVTATLVASVMSVIPVPMNFVITHPVIAMANLAPPLSDRPPALLAFLSTVVIVQ